MIVTKDRTATSSLSLLLTVSEKCAMVEPKMVSVFRPFGGVSIGAN